MTLLKPAEAVALVTWTLIGTGILAKKDPDAELEDKTSGVSWSK